MVGRWEKKAAAFINEFDDLTICWGISTRTEEESGGGRTNEPETGLPTFSSNNSKFFQQCIGLI
jgi:hypothetical protein